MKHLLVTNDFPPKVGGIQVQLWELWRRLDPTDFVVLTTPYPGAEIFDAKQPFRVIRTKQKWLLPTPSLRRQIDQTARDFGAELIVLDPALPLGLIGPRLERPFVLFSHGAEFVIPASIPGVRSVLRRLIRQATGLVASGNYVGDAMKKLAAGQCPPIEVVPPGVDVERFRPLSEFQRQAARQKWGISENAVFVLGLSRLVPRKGFDRLIRAASETPGLEVLIAGKGRQMNQLQRLVAKTGAPVRMLGRVDDNSLPELVGAADIFAMPCHDRWLGLEQEGFGIVFVEASAAAVPVVAGQSGGSSEAVLDGQTGVVVPGRANYRQVAKAVADLAASASQRRQLGLAGRARMEAEFAYPQLADRLGRFLDRLNVSNH